MSVSWRAAPPIRGAGSCERGDSHCAFFGSAEGVSTDSGITDSGIRPTDDALSAPSRNSRRPHTQPPSFRREDPAYWLAADAGGIAGDVVVSGAVLVLGAVEVAGPAPGAPLVMGSSRRLQPADSTAAVVIRAIDKTVMRFMGFLLFRE
jgi:hypothetical protein